MYQQQLHAKSLPDHHHQAHELNEADHHLQEIIEGRRAFKQSVIFHARLIQDHEPLLVVHDKLGRQLEAKRVHFIRHGEGFHNAWAAQWHRQNKSGDPYLDPQCPRDPDLTPLGIQQAQAIQPTIALWNSDTNTQHIHAQPQLIVVSPLSRAIQTAIHALHGSTWDANANTSNATYIAHDYCQEQGGLHSCDQRLNKDQIKLKFPNLDVQLLAEKDIYWGDGSTRESKADMFPRIFQFLLWIRNRAENNIFIATHSGFLLTLFRGLLTFTPDEIEQHPRANDWFTTGELRSIQITFEDTDNVV